jgi:hypothetical protein
VATSGSGTGVGDAVPLCAGDAEGEGLPPAGAAEAIAAMQSRTQQLAKTRRGRLIMRYSFCNRRRPPDGSVIRAKLGRNAGVIKPDLAGA